MDPDKSLVPYRGAMSRAPGGMPWGVFCASPTVLEAINNVLQQKGMRQLWVLPDGSIGPTDPLLLRMEYVPSPFVW
jgi:hypothetical protein